MLEADRLRLGLINRCVPFPQSRIRDSHFLNLTPRFRASLAAIARSGNVHVSVPTGRDWPRLVRLVEG